MSVAISGLVTVTHRPPWFLICFRDAAGHPEEPAKNEEGAGQLRPELLWWLAAEPPEAGPL
jgi:hypothetical protein